MNFVLFTFRFASACICFEIGRVGVSKYSALKYYFPTTNCKYISHGPNAPMGTLGLKFSFVQSSVLPTLQIFLKMADFQLYLQMKFSQKSAQIFDLNGRFVSFIRFLYKLCKFWQIWPDKSFKKPFLKIKNDFNFAKKLSHKNAIKGHIFGDADFAYF